MDRNSGIVQIIGHIYTVALRKESVDRNIILPKQLNRPTPSLSARRAWIEINVRSQPSKPRRVALRKESVDRNLYYQDNMRTPPRSLSARRAWIEMSMGLDGRFKL